jgi:hypothetical protein
MASGDSIVSAGVAALLALFVVSNPAEADPAISNAAKTTADNAAPRPPRAAAGQISQVDGVNRSIESGQISASPRDSRAASAAQLATPTHPAASTQIAAPAAGRNTQVSAIVGQDRCDPTAPTAQQPECAQILDTRGDDFAGGGTDNTPSTVDSQATSGDLVNGIVSSGTGSVVHLPPK